MTTIQINDRQLATILAALRVLQIRTKEEERRDVFPDYYHEAAPLTDKDIDELCENINTSQDTVQAVYDILYLDIDRDGEFYNPDKEWDADTTSLISELVTELIPSPGESAYVTCKFCDRGSTRIAVAHRHDHGWVCPECWDERLRATE